MATSSFELERILDSKKDGRKKWYFLCTWKEYKPEEDKREPTSSFIHGYTDTYIKFPGKNFAINYQLSRIKDCLTKEELQAHKQAPIVARAIHDKI